MAMYEQKNKILRPYQRFLCDEAKGKNTIILLPTGAGKTLVGAEIIREKLLSQQHEGLSGHGVRGGIRGKLIVFLVPTCFLVKQQANEVRSWIGKPASSVGEFSGDIKTPPNFNLVDVLVCTPESFRMKQRQNQDILGWANISLLIFDEVHHVLKDHPFREIALSLKQFIKDQAKHANNSSTIIAAECREFVSARHFTQVVGLTALLTYAVNEDKVRKVQEQLCRELDIDIMPYISKERLQKDGFHAGSSTVTEIEDQVEIPDIFEADKVLPENERKPHLMHATFRSRIKSEKATSFAKDLVEIITDIETYIQDNSPVKFVSPLDKPQLASWGSYANQQAKKCKKVTWNQLYSFLEHWYEALRIVVTNWEEAKGLELAVLFLKMMEKKLSMELAIIPLQFKMGAQNGTVLSGKIDLFFRKYDVFPHLTHIIYQLLRMKSQKEELRAIIFVQQKTTAHILSYHLNCDLDLVDTGLQAVPLHSTTTAPPSASISFSPTNAKQSLEEFSNGTKQILVTTTVAEEGMDIPKSNCVIRFDPIQTGVSLVQGRGRARHEDSTHIITAQRSDRPVTTFENVESIQAELSQNFIPSKASEETIQREMKAQESREFGAIGGLRSSLSTLTSQTAVGVLNLYVKKTKASLEESFGNGMFILVYSSCLRTVQADFRPPPGHLMKTKKEQKAAKQEAALLLIHKLLS